MGLVQCMDDLLVGYSQPGQSMSPSIRFIPVNLKAHSLGIYNAGCPCRSSDSPGIQHAHGVVPRTGHLNRRDNGRLSHVKGGDAAHTDQRVCDGSSCPSKSHRDIRFGVRNSNGGVIVVFKVVFKGFATRVRLTPLLELSLVAGGLSARHDTSTNDNVSLQQLCLDGR